VRHRSTEAIMAQAVGKQVTVISYNLLAPMLCTQDRFTTSHQSNLTPHLRLEKVREAACVCVWGGDSRLCVVTVVTHCGWNNSFPISS
jgi:hypothetical protein